MALTHHFKDAMELIVHNVSQYFLDLRMLEDVDLVLSVEFL
jgi:hypothetical protein